MKNNNYKITILGCGSSGGVPTIENKFGTCNPSNLKNHRTRTSILIEINDFNILIDTSPNLREQCLINNINKVDCILYTHFHADHISGIYDVRSFNRIKKSTLPCYLTKETYAQLQTAYELAFRDTSDIKNNHFHRPALVPHLIESKVSFKVLPRIEILPLDHIHGKIATTGFKVNNKIGYITDFSSIPDDILTEYTNLETLIISACTPYEHNAHMKYSEVIQLINYKLKPKFAYLTHMSEFIDYDAAMLDLQQNNLNNIFLCYDTLVISG